MANRRMFSLDIVASDAFLDMPASSRELYFQLGMYADDDGFVNPKKIMRMTGASDDDLKVLLTKRFVLAFQSGVIVIKHWLIHNSIKSERHKETRYVEEKSQLRIKENKAYTDDLSQGRLLPILSENKGIRKVNLEENYRQKAEEESSLPYSFNYKIRYAFIGKKCPICGNEMRESPIDKLDYDSKRSPLPSIQHNIPLSLGGKHELGNISVVCKSCNTSIQDKETGELNAKEVIEVWESIQSKADHKRITSGSQTDPQDRLGKDRLGKDNLFEFSNPKETETYQKNDRWLKEMTTEGEFQKSIYNYSESGPFDWRYLINHGKGLNPVRYVLALYWKRKQEFTRLREDFGSSYSFSVRDLAKMALKRDWRVAKEIASCMTFEQFKKLIDIADERAWDDKQNKYKWEWQLSTLMKDIEKLNG
jgi:hypothetical protein